MNFRQILTAPNQLTLLRMIFLPFIVINLVKHDFKWALALFILAGIATASMACWPAPCISKRCSASISTPSPTSC